MLDYRGESAKRTAQNWIFCSIHSVTVLAVLALLFPHKAILGHRRAGEEEGYLPPRRHPFESGGTGPILFSICPKGFGGGGGGEEGLLWIN